MTAVEVLTNYRKQLDADGIEVGVNRQALEEVLAQLAEAQSLIERYQRGDLVV